MIAGAVLVAIVLFIFADYVNKQRSIPSKNILLLTYPVQSFSGTIDKVEGNTLRVSRKQIESSPVKLGEIPKKPKEITISYSIIISDKTKVYRPFSIPVPYLFKTSDEVFSDATLSIKDIKVGQKITANTVSDLRTLQSSQFEATVITIPPITSILSGTITQISGNIVTIKAISPIIDEYQITVTPDTEISGYVSTATAQQKFIPGTTRPAITAKKYQLSDLKNGMQIMVYTADDPLFEKKPTALRIDPKMNGAVPAFRGMVTPVVTFYPTP
jgi:hypothetical protein